MQVKIRPCKSIRTSYLFSWIISIFIVFEVSGILLSKNLIEFWFGNLVMAGFIAAGVIVYFFTGLLYNSYFIFNENEIIKYKGKKVVFKVKIEQIVELGYRKANAMMHVLSPLWFLFGDPMCGVLSIRFFSAEIYNDRKYDSILKLVSLKDQDVKGGLKEYCDCFTQKEVNKICQYLKLTYRNIDLATEY